ncbi:hypothetical protein FKP32DRAFT_1685607, partial [Trametes sanguinea]
MVQWAMPSAACCAQTTRSGFWRLGALGSGLRTLGSGLRTHGLVCELLVLVCELYPGPSHLRARAIRGTVLGSYLGNHAPGLMPDYLSSEPDTLVELPKRRLGSLIRALQGITTPYISAAKKDVKEMVAIEVNECLFKL